MDKTNQFIYTLCLRTSELHTYEFRIVLVLSITYLASSLFAVNILAQHYLPPKIIGDGSKNPVQEPILPVNYVFPYDLQDNAVSLDSGHYKKSKEDQASGSYHILLPDGRPQLVGYEAGPDGYKPQVVYMGTTTSLGVGTGDKFDGYYYNATSNRQSIRKATPRGSARQPSPSTHPSPFLPKPSSNVTQ